ELLMTVTDTGIGMRQEDIPRIFEPFHQIEDSLTRKHEGTGLGLPLAKKLCELHDASIGIETAPGRGTEVRVRFPATRTI
ncbi:MAG: ATP-binding protein, partial [Alphaproteobacteria bacterium]|nr:ATP-binding protein [Alphaproteobacteria bacterium]